MPTLAGAAPDSFEIEAELGYRDALAAALDQAARRAPKALLAYGLLVALLVALAVAAPSALGWLLVPALLPAATTVGWVVWQTRTGIRGNGGKRPRMRYHFCAEGVEISARGNADWIAWQDVWDACETPRGFLLCPTPGEQYVIPRRCCGESAGRLREMFRRLAAGSETAPPLRAVDSEEPAP